MTTLSTFPSWWQDFVLTTDATLTTVATVAIPASTIVAIEARTVARRTGGSAGSAEDGAYYRAAACYQNIGGTATLIGQDVSPVIESNAAWAFSFAASGGNALIQVTGDTNNTIIWQCAYHLYQATT